MMIPRLRKKKHKMSLEYLVVPKIRECLKNKSYQKDTETNLKTTPIAKFGTIRAVK